MLRQAIVLIALGVLLVSCGMEGVYVAPCEHCDECPERCSPLATAWEGPMLLWSGTEEDAPGCPGGVGELLYEGHADVQDEIACPSCGCGPAVCTMPTTLKVSTAKCPADSPGTMHLYVETPSGWDGSCFGTIEISTTQYKSSVFGNPDVAPCVPVEGPVPPSASESPWRTFARACRATEPPPACEDPAGECASTTGLPSGFASCILALNGGDPACPADYPDKHIFHGGLEDTRACLPCACGDPTEEYCEVLSWISRDDDCRSHFAGRGASTHPESLSCGDHASGYTIASTSSMLMVAIPGVCAPSGGTPVGEAAPLAPATFCCQP